MPRYGGRRAGKRRFQIENKTSKPMSDKLDLEKLAKICPEMFDKTPEYIPANNTILMPEKNWDAIARRFFDMAERLKAYEKVMNNIEGSLGGYRGRCTTCRGHRASIRHLRERTAPCKSKN